MPSLHSIAPSNLTNPPQPMGLPIYLGKIDFAEYRALQQSVRVRAEASTPHHSSSLPTLPPTYLGKIDFAEHRALQQSVDAVNST